MLLQCYSCPLSLLYKTKVRYEFMAYGFTVDRIEILKMENLSTIRHSLLGLHEQEDIILFLESWFGYSCSFFLTRWGEFSSC